MKRIVLALLTLALAFGSSACDLLSKLTDLTKPTNTTTQTLAGNWTTVQSLAGSSGSLQHACVNFKWNVTQISGTSGSGTFSATCVGNVQVAGSASGTLSGSTVNWSANATGTIQGQPPCAIALTGTATFEADNRIRIPYAGTTCLGPVSGTEIITR
jgi:hypothetical protein